MVNQLSFRPFLGGGVAEKTPFKTPAFWGAHLVEPRFFVAEKNLQTSETRGTRRLSPFFLAPDLHVFFATLPTFGTEFRNCLGP